MAFADTIRQMSVGEPTSAIMRRIALLATNPALFFLRGLEGYFKASTNRPAILCEIIPSAYPLLGYTLVQLSEYMKQHGYRAFSLYDTYVELDIEEPVNITSLVFQAI